ncbi:unnamed protein product [Withania somnifera]
MKQETIVLIIGAGIATSAFLERDNSFGSLWRKRCYDRLKLHLASQFCELPYMSFPPNSLSNFNVNPLYQRVVECAFFDNVDGKWHVKAINVENNVDEHYIAWFLVVATGENSEGFLPKIEGLDGFGGRIMHSSEYGNGKSFEVKDVLVIGCGNSGMEIAYDLSNLGAHTSIVVRSHAHILTKEMIQMGMLLLNYIPCNIVDQILMTLSKLTYGDLSLLGLNRPKKGPFYLKHSTGRSPVIDVGTVLPSIKKIKGNYVKFMDGKKKQFDALIFATGYKTTVTKWLKDDGVLFNEKGMPKRDALITGKESYCVGFASSGLNGISFDAKNVAEDTNRILMHVGSEMDETASSSN